MRARATAEQRLDSQRSDEISPTPPPHCAQVENRVPCRPSFAFKSAAYFSTGSVAPRNSAKWLNSISRLLFWSRSQASQSSTLRSPPSSLLSMHRHGPSALILKMSLPYLPQCQIRLFAQRAGRAAQHAISRRRHKSLDNVQEERCKVHEALQFIIGTVAIDPGEYYFI